MGLITSALSGERALAVAGLGAGGPREAVHLWYTGGREEEATQV